MGDDEAPYYGFGKRSAVKQNRTTFQATLLCNLGPLLRS